MTIVDITVLIVIYIGFLEMSRYGRDRKMVLANIISGILIVFFATHGIPLILGLEVLGVNSEGFLKQTDTVYVVVPKEGKEMILSGEYDLDELDKKYDKFLISQSHIERDDAFIVRLEDKHDKSSYTIISE